MIANLPLLFANGMPTSLGNIRIPELERFITFMVQCSLGHDTVRIVQKPAWWPNDVQFSNPFRPPPVVPLNWGTLLRQLVRQCYEYHECTYLLGFSAKLARHSRRKLNFVDNGDRTTSICDKSSGRILVTFRNENLLYDQAYRWRLNPKPVKTSRLRPSDIYLCDYCDSHFDSYVGLQTHERLCGPAPLASEPTAQPSAPPSPEGSLDSFINAIGLRRTENAEPQGDEQISPSEKVTVRQCRSSSNEAAFLVPFSSLAGQKYARTQHKYLPEHAYDRNERYCSILPLSFEQPRWMIKRHTQQTYPIRFRKPEGYWLRPYRVANARYRFALDLRTQLLYLQCKPLRISIERLCPSVVEKYEKIRRENREKSKLLKRHHKDDDVEFVREITISEDVIDLCSDDDEGIGNENADPKASLACRLKNGFQQSSPTAGQTPFLQPLEPCGTARQRNATITIKDSISHTALTQPLNNIQVILLEE